MEASVNPQQSLPLSELITSCINDALVETLGESGAMVLSVYDDPRGALKDPRVYEERLRSVLGRGSNFLLDAMRDRLCAAASRVPKPTCTGMADCLRCVAESQKVGGSPSCSS